MAAVCPPSLVALRQSRHSPRLCAHAPRRARTAAGVPRGLDRSRARVRHPAVAAAALRAATRRGDGRLRADGRVPSPRRHVGSRAFHRRGDVRGSWLVRHRQPASRPHRQGRGAHEPGRRRVRACVPRVGTGRLRGHRGARTRDQKAALDRSACACGLSGRARRGPRSTVRGHAPPAPCGGRQRALGHQQERECSTHCTTRPMWWSRPGT